MRAPNTVGALVFVDRTLAVGAADVLADRATWLVVSLAVGGAAAPEPHPAATAAAITIAIKRFTRITTRLQLLTCAPVLHPVADLGYGAR